MSDFGGRWSVTLKNRGRSKKTEGRTRPKSRGGSLAVGTYLQRGSAPPPPPPPLLPHNSTLHAHVAPPRRPLGPITVFHHNQPIFSKCSVVKYAPFVVIVHQHYVYMADITQTFKVTMKSEMEHHRNWKSSGQLLDRFIGPAS